MPSLRMGHLGRLSEVKAEIENTKYKAEIQNTSATLSLGNPGAPGHTKNFAFVLQKHVGLI